MNMRLILIYHWQVCRNLKVKNCYTIFSYYSWVILICNCNFSFFQNLPLYKYEVWTHYFFIHYFFCTKIFIISFILYWPDKKKSQRKFSLIASFSVHFYYSFYAMIITENNFVTYRRLYTISSPDIKYTR